MFRSLSRDFLVQIDAPTSKIAQICVLIDKSFNTNGPSLNSTFARIPHVYINLQCGCTRRRKKIKAEPSLSEIWVFFLLCGLNRCMKIQYVIVARKVLISLYKSMLCFLKPLIFQICKRAAACSEYRNWYLRISLQKCKISILMVIQ